MPGLVPRIHVLARGGKERGQLWEKPGHDEPPPGHRREASSSPRPAMTTFDNRRFMRALNGCEHLRKRRTAPSPSCPALCRVSTSLLAAQKHVDGRDKPGHDGLCGKNVDRGTSARSKASSRRPAMTTFDETALSRCEQLRKRRTAPSPPCPALCRASTSLLA